MSTPVDRIGETAGLVWHYLNEHGATSLTAIAERVKVPRDLAMLAVGWLAREEKVEVSESGRTKTITLKNS